jgi:antirestriction protein
MTMTEIRIFLGCLASYNAGRIHGRWVDATLGVDHLEEELADILKTSSIPRAEEYDIQDAEGFAGSVGRYSSLEEVAELGELIEKHGVAIVELMNHIGCDRDELEKKFEELNRGEWESEREFAWEHLQTNMNVPEHLENFICIEKVEQSLFMGDHFSVKLPNGNVHVFASN